ncbi:hypothetical protein DY000_02021853 [Brassica cretica]|uniref:Uncharacterized protein n=1 Tax=Brassica cretica TaxID=69181 RepID=A0ABQ7E6H2_BRACR|nr:hypothetical protein DY000_02021853 [Brassica cretica]
MENIEADSEAILMVPLRRHRSCFFDDGPHSEIREGDLADMRRKYVIHPSVKYPLSLVSVLLNLLPLPGGLYRLSKYSGNFMDFSSGGIRGNYPFGDGWNNRYVFVKIQEPFGYPTSWRTVIAKLIMGVPRRFRRVTFLVSKEALRHSPIWGNMVRLSVSAIYDEHQKAKTWKRRPFYTSPPRLARAASSVNGLSSTHQRVQNMMARRDLLVHQVRASRRWELMKEWLEKRVEHWDPEEEYR